MNKFKFEGFNQEQTDMMEVLVNHLIDSHKLSVLRWHHSTWLEKVNLSYRYGGEYNAHVIFAIYDQMDKEEFPEKTNHEISNCFIGALNCIDELIESFPDNKKLRKLIKELRNVKNKFDKEVEKSKPIDEEFDDLFA